LVLQPKMLLTRLLKPLLMEDRMPLFSFGLFTGAPWGWW